MKKLIIVMLITALVAGFSACSNSVDVSDSGNSQVTGSSDQSLEGNDGKLDLSKKIDIEIMTFSPATIDPEDGVLKHYSEKFNANVTMTAIIFDKYNDAINLRIAAGDYPELFKTQIPDNMVIYSSLHQDDQIVNISEYADKYGFENIKNHLKLPNIEAFKEEDGYYVLPNYTGPTGNALYVRQDWVDELGLELPKDTDEFKEFLRVMVEKDPDGQKTTGLVSAVGGLISNFSTIFTGVSADDWIQENGEWKFIALTDGYRDMLRYLAELYHEGLLDNELYLNTPNEVFKKMATGKAAVALENGLRAQMSKIEGPLKETNPDAELGVIVPWPKAKGMEKATINGGTGHFSGVHVPTCLDEIARSRTLALVDYMLSEEGQIVITEGIEGVHYNVVNGEKLYEKDRYDKDFIGGEPHLTGALMTRSATSWRLENDERLLANRTFCLENAVFSNVIGLRSDKVTELNPALKDVLDKWQMKFITGEASVDSDWDKFVDEYNKAGYPEMVEEVKKFMQN